MLIKCPECGKEISDKSKQCIHCGFPLDEQKNENICKIFDNSYDLSEELKQIIDGNTVIALKSMRDKYGLQFKESMILKNIIEQTHKIPPVFDDTTIVQYEKETNMNKPQPTVPRCPICNSTNLSKISTAKKVAKVAAFGIFGMGDNGKTWKCNNCGSKF